MPKYKFSVGDRVFLLRSSNNPDEEIYRACLGEVIDLNSIDHTPYCYETVFDNDPNKGFLSLSNYFPRETLGSSQAYIISTTIFANTINSA